jgi:putative heme-binding domain-containing protein
MQGGRLCTAYNVETISIEIPKPSKDPFPDVQKILKIKGNPKTGKMAATACRTCHKIGSTGVEYGPVLTQFVKSQPAEVVIKAIINPSAEITHGYEGFEVKTKSNKIIHGRILSRPDPIIIQSTGGVTQIIPKDKVESISPLKRSLMPRSNELGLNENQIADIYAYLLDVN